MDKQTNIQGKKVFNKIICFAETANFTSEKDKVFLKLKYIFK